MASISLFWLLVLTLIAGLAMVVGALIARLEDFHSDWLQSEIRHGVAAFGGGSLMSAVALVLVPEGIEHLHVSAAAVLMISGGGCFLLLDRYLAFKRTSASQLAAMLSDFIPESMALGAAFALGSESAVLLVALIAMQNAPEGFNAYREMVVPKGEGALGLWRKPNYILIAFTSMAFLGPAAAAIGYFWLATEPMVVSAVMLFASGGILYSIFQDIAPQARLEHHWGPPMGAVLGFVLGMVGFMLV